MLFLKKSEMRGDCDAIPTQQDITSRAFLRNKQDKEERTNTFRNSIQRERMPPMGNGILRECVLSYEGEVIRILTLYLHSNIKVMHMSSIYALSVNIYSL